MLRGLGVTMALPWMESLRLGRSRRAGTKPASEAPVRLAVLFSGNGFHSKEWWAKGEGKQMELGKVLAPLQRLPREDALRPRPLQCRGAQGEHPQLADRQSALRRAAGFRRRDSFRHQHRPVAGAALRALDQGAEPRARLREVEPVGPQELLDALQLAHFVELADHADAARDLSRARVRPAVQGRSEQGRQERARRRAGRCGQPAPRASAPDDQRKLDEYLDSVRDVEAAHRERRQEGRVAGLAADA